MPAITACTAVTCMTPYKLFEVIRPPNVIHELFLSFFYQCTMLSSRAVDGHQMYFAQSVVGKASTTDIEISPTPPIIFRGGQKVRNLALFSTSITSEPLVFENAARYLNAETNFFCRNDRPMLSPSLVKLGPRNPENRWAEMPHP